VTTIRIRILATVSGLTMTNVQRQSQNRWRRAFSGEHAAGFSPMVMPSLSSSPLSVCHFVGGDARQAASYFPERRITRGEPSRGEIFLPRTENFLADTGFQQQQTLTPIRGRRFRPRSHSRRQRGLVQKGALYVLPCIACGPARRHVSIRL
jgi:hypothetical protein